MQLEEATQGFVASEEDFVVALGKNSTLVEVLVVAFALLALELVR